MKIGSAVKGVSKAGFRGSWTILARFRLFLMFFFIGIMFINSFLISFEARDPTPGIQYLGEKFLFATENLGEHSKSIIEQGGIYDGNIGVMKGSWGAIKSLYYIGEAIFVIYLWIKVLTFFILHFIVWDSSKQAVAGSIAVFFFFGLQMIVILAFTDKELLTPFYAFYDFLRSLPYVFKPITNIAEKFSK